MMILRLSRTGCNGHESAQPATEAIVFEKKKTSRPFEAASASSFILNLLFLPLPAAQSTRCVACARYVLL